MKAKFTTIISVLLALSMALSVTSSAKARTTVPPDSETTIISTQTEQTPDVPDEPENNEDPVEPDTPDNPDNPENPDDPENPDNPEIPDNPDIPDIPDEPDEPEQPKPTFDEISGDTVVGRMYICTQIIGLGHSWIYIESTFDGEIPVGCYTMKPFGSVSVGTFLFSRSDGGGLYYNVERYCANEYGLKGQHWLGMDITKDDLETVSKEIKGWNYWGLYLNCTFFASKVWNSVSGKFIMPMMFPVFIKMQTKIKGGNSDVVMQDVEPDECFKQKGSGKNARIEVVCDGTLDSKLM